MASPHSREFPSCQHKLLVIPPFSDDTDSRTASALAPPWLLSATDFMDFQLLKLTRLNDWLNRLNQSFNPLIVTCFAGIVPIAALTAVCLVRLHSDIQELTGPAKQGTTGNYPRWLQVNARR